MSTRHEPQLSRTVAGDWVWRRPTDGRAELVIPLVGELDMANRTAVEQACLASPAGGSVVVDIDQLTFMDCAGYGGLAAARRAIEQQGGTLRITNPHGEPARLLHLIEGSAPRKIDTVGCC